VVQRPAHFNAFEFVVLSSLRAQQLIRGCTPRVEGTGKLITIAQTEIAQAFVVRDPVDGPPTARHSEPAAKPFLPPSVMELVGK
jgi:DNA-directed RNA polymerase subunit K/omega